MLPLREPLVGVRPSNASAEEPQLPVLMLLRRLSKDTLLSRSLSMLVLCVWCIGDRMSAISVIADMVLLKLSLVATLGRRKKASMLPVLPQLDTRANPVWFTERLLRGVSWVCRCCCLFGGSKTSPRLTMEGVRSLLHAPAGRDASGNAGPVLRMWRWTAATLNGCCMLSGPRESTLFNSNYR